MGKKARKKPERMSDFHFKLMNIIFHIIDFVYPYIDKRIRKFGIKQDMTVVDYGCGPGRYTTRFAKIVGEQGRVFAVDIHELAVEMVTKKIEKQAMGSLKMEDQPFFKKLEVKIWKMVSLSYS